MNRTVSDYRTAVRFVIGPAAVIGLKPDRFNVLIFKLIYMFSPIVRLFLLLLKKIKYKSTKKWVLVISANGIFIDSRRVESKNNRTYRTAAGNGLKWHYERSFITALASRIALPILLMLASSSLSCIHISCNVLKLPIELAGAANELAIDSRDSAILVKTSSLFSITRPNNKAKKLTIVLKRGEYDNLRN